MKETTIYLIKNTSDKKKLLIDFLSELYEVDPIAKKYPFFRLWTDTYSVLPREYEPQKIYEVKFVVDVCILGKMMNQINNSGTLPSFKYIKIMDDKGYLLSNGERIEDPYKRAINDSKSFFN